MTSLIVFNAIAIAVVIGLISWGITALVRAGEKKERVRQVTENAEASREVVEVRADVMEKKDEEVRSTVKSHFVNDDSGVQ